VTLLFDSNIWIAAQDRQNRDHGACSALLLEYAGRLAATVPVITGQHQASPSTNLVIA
jgi:predicted nucleic acid-binding protein